MARTNKLIELVFSDIKRFDTIQQFLDVDDALSLPVDPILQKFKNLYVETIESIKAELELLADLEEIIVQMRCEKFTPKNFNLSITNNSIYVKLLFYRENRKIKDIRIIAGNVATFGDDLDALANDQSFIDMFTEKAKAAMAKEIQKTYYKLITKMKTTSIYI